MRKALFLFFFFITVFVFEGLSQTIIYVDLTGSANISKTYSNPTRSGNYCGSNNCTVFIVTLNPGSDLLNITSSQLSGADFYKVNCGPQTSVGTPVCISGSIQDTISFCKPGNNPISYTITASSSVSATGNQTLRQGCSGTMNVTGLTAATATWTSIYPGSAGAYNGYLSCTVCSTPTVIPAIGAPAYIDYRVSGTLNNCPNTRADTIRIYAVPPMTVSISPLSAVICSGSAVNLAATVTGGNLPYTYLWSSGETTSSIVPSTAGTYTVTVSDNTTGCGSISQSVTVTANPIPSAPTASGVAVCNGSSATLTTTGPGGTYQWYDAPSGGTFLFTGSSYTTPALTVTTTYYVQTTINGCTSPRTPVTVTVNPIPVAPTASPVTICNGSVATLTASAPGGSYAWYNAPSGGTLLFTGASYTTPALTATTTYYVETTVNGCTSPRTTVTVTVNPIPVAPTAANASICSGSLATLTATAPGGTYEWYDAPTGGTLLFTGVSYTTPVLITTTYYVQTTVNGCTSPRTPVTVTVNPIPAAPTASGTTICLGSSANLTATGPGGIYQWYDASSGGNLLFTGASYTTSPLISNTTYYVQTSVNGCTSLRTQVNVIVSPVTASPTVSPLTICSGSVATLTATAPGGSYDWYDASSGGNLLFTGASYSTPVLTATTTYYVQATVNGCISARTAVTVTVNPIPAAPTALGTTTCSGSVVVLSATAPGGNYEWYDAASGGNLLLNGSNFTTPALTATTIYYIQTTVNGCTSARTAVTVTVNPIPAAPTISGQTICSGTSAVLSPSAPGGTYRWYNVASGGSILATGNFTTPALTNTTIYYVETIVNGCTSSARTPVTVTVNPIPAAPTASSVTICGGSTATLTATGPGGTYEWYDAPSGGTLLFTGTIYTTTALITTTTYYVQATVNGCTGARTAVTATVNPVPAAPTAPGTAICSGNTTTLTASAPGGTYQWYDAPIGGTLLFIGASYTTPVLITTTTYYVQTTINGCTSAFTAVTVIVNPSPVAPAVSGVTICQGTPATLTATAPGGTYQWYNAASGGTLLFTGNTYTTPALSTTTNYYVQAVSAAGCAGPRTLVTASVTPPPNPAFYYSSGTFCTTSANVIPVYIIPEGGTFSSTPGGLVFVDNHTGEINVAASIPGTYSITFITGTVCAYSSSELLTITAAPDPSFSYSGPYCQQGANPVPTFIGTGSAGVFSSTDPNLVFLNQSTGEIDLQHSLPGTYTVHNTIPPSGVCSVVDAISTVTIKPTPVINSAASATVCDNTAQNYTITSTVPGTTYTWSRALVTGISNAAVSGQTSSTITEALVNTTSAPIAATYIITPLANGCAGPDFNYTVTVNPTPVVTSPASYTTCDNISQIYFITGNVIGATYTWSRAAVAGISNTAVSGQAGSMIAETLVNTSSAPVAVTYVITPQANGCPGPDFNYTLTVNPTPVVTSPSSASLCNNVTQNYTITSNVSGVNFTWSRAAMGGISNTAVSGQTSSTITEALVNTSSAPVAVTYIITPQANGCIGPDFNYTVTVNPTPVVTSPASVTVCDNTAQNYNITSNVPGTTYTWSRALVTGISNAAVSGQTSNTITEALINTTSAPVTATYIITPLANVCPGPDFNYTVTVNPTPVGTSPATNIVCNVTTQNYTITSNVSGATFTWSRAAVAGISNAAVSGQNSSTITEVLTNTTFAPVAVNYVITPLANGCSGTPFNYTVTVNPPPAITSLATNIVCNGTTQNYSITGNVSGTTFTWSRTLVTGISNAAVSGQTSSTITETLVNTSTVPITATYIITPLANGCPGPDFNYTVTVNPTPVVTSPATNIVCNGTTQNYSITGNVSGTTYTWSRALVTGISNAAVSGQTGSTITETLVNTSTAPVTVTYVIIPQANGCTGTPFNYTVTVNPTPIVTSPASATLCNNFTQNYTIASNVIGATYIWNRAAVAGISNSAVSNTSNTINEVLTNTTSVPITVTYIIIPQTNGCSGPTFNYTVTVNPTPVITSAASATLCNNITQNYTIASNVIGATYIWNRTVVAGISNAAVSGQTSGTITETLVNTSTAPVSVTYVITPQANGCSGPVFNYTVTVNPTPVITSPATNIICNGTAQNYTITGNVSGTTFTWNRAVVAGISNLPVNGQTSSTITETLVNTILTPVAVTYVITSQANGCTGPAFNYTVTVNPTPVVTSPASATICDSTAQNYIITSNVSGTAYTWNRATVAGISNAAASGQISSIIDEVLINKLSVPVTVTYTIIPEVNGCTGPAFNYTVTVNPTPVITSPATVTVCDNIAQNYTITSNVSGTTFTWSRALVTGISNATVSGQTSSTITETLVNTSAVPIMATYIITPLANGCPGPAFNYTVTVNPTPVVTSPATNIVCNGTTQNYSIIGNVSGTTYTWSRATVAGISNSVVSGQTSSTITETLVNTSSVPVTVTYTIIPQANGCYGPAFKYTVTVNPTLTPVVRSNSPVCSGSSLNLNVNNITGASYSWTGPNGFTSIIQNPVILAATSVNAGSYYVTASIGGCAGTTSSIDIVVNEAPINPVISSNSPVCSGGPIQIGVTSYAGAVYQWTGPNGFTSNQQNPVIDNSVTANQGRYTVSITSPGCSVPTTAFADIIVNQTPAPPLTSNNSPVCAGQSLQLSAASITGAIYQWKGPNGFTSNQQNPIINNICACAAGTYSVSVIVNSCTSTSTNTVVVVNQPATVNAGNDQTVCANNSIVSLYGSVTDGSSTGIWITSGSGTFTAGNTALTGTYIPSVADIAAGTVTLTLTATNTASCTPAVKSIKITINPTPIVFAGNDQEICADQDLALNGTVTNAGSGVWSSSGTGRFIPSNISLNASYVFSDNDKQAGKVVLTLTSTGNSNCLPVSAQMNVQIIPSPVVQPIPDAYVLQKETLVLQPAVTGTDLKYNWVPNLYLNDNTIKNPIFTGVEDVTYTLTVTGKAGCIAESKMTIKVLKPIILTNTFTPNGDGINDTWEIKELNDYPGVTVSIFNRYGTQLYYSNRYPKAWDGTYNGKQVPFGVYYYLINIKNFNKVLSGWVTVVR